MIVILAGCDGTGKSTCFKKLRQSSIEANFIKESYTDDGSSKTIRSLFVASKINDNDLTIYDRATILDDIVYEQVMANKVSDLLLTVGYENLTQTLNKCIIIYFDLDDVELTNRLTQRGDDYITVHQINKIKKCYKDTFKKLNINYINFNVTGLSEDDVANKVKEIIANEKSKNC